MNKSFNHSFSLPSCVTLQMIWLVLFSLVTGINLKYFCIDKNTDPLSLKQIGYLGNGGGIVSVLCCQMWHMEMELKNLMNGLC